MKTQYLEPIFFNSSMLSFSALYVVLLSFVGVSEKVIKHWLFAFFAMNNLETMVRNEEVQQAIEFLQKPILSEIVSHEVPEEQEETPIIEQDPVSFDDPSYSIEISEYDEATYEPTKNYYELLMGEDGPKASYEFMSHHENNYLQEAQEIATNSKQAEETRSVYVESDLDFRKKHVKENIKMTSIGLWFVMYDHPNLIFN